MFKVKCNLCKCRNNTDDAIDMRYSENTIVCMYVHMYTVRPVLSLLATVLKIHLSKSDISRVMYAYVLYTGQTRL